MQSIKPALFLLLTTAPAFAQTSVKDGHFLDPSVWDTGRVPPPGADVVIRDGTTVGLVPQGMSVEPVRLKSLRVEGTLTSSWPLGQGGEPVVLEVARFECPDGGAVLGEPSASGPGGSIHISYDDRFLPIGNQLEALEDGPYEFISHGTLAAGDGLDGGDVVIDYPGGRFEHCGLMVGGQGARGGSVRVLATVAENFQVGRILGGPGGAGGGGSADLVVTTTAESDAALLINMPGGRVAGGSSGGGPGGDAGLAAYDPFGRGADLFHDTPQLPGETPAELLGGDGAEPGRAWIAARNGAVLGIVRGGADLTLDPELPAGDVHIAGQDLVLAETCQIAGGAVVLRSEGSLFCGPFVGQPAISAAQLELAAAPGALVDLGATLPGDVVCGSSALFVGPGPLVLPLGTPPELLLPGLDAIGPGLFEPAARLTATSTAIARSAQDGAFDLRIDLHVGLAGTGPGLVEVLLLADPALGLPPVVPVVVDVFDPAVDLRTSIELPLEALLPAPSPLGLELRV
ncbi:MAG: hypothetical protein AAFZ65_07230, partial [Planctomycetota bacterium]